MPPGLYLSVDFRLAEWQGTASPTSSLLQQPLLLLVLVQDLQEGLVNVRVLLEPCLINTCPKWEEDKRTCKV